MNTDHAHYAHASLSGRQKAGIVYPEQEGHFIYYMVKLNDFPTRARPGFSSKWKRVLLIFVNYMVHTGKLFMYIRE
jgi:hypothetical protein